MNIERMRIVERVLLEVIREGRLFDMDVWAEASADRKTYDDCGTAACAAGWTARDQEAQARGLWLRRGVPTFGDKQGEFAMARWLDIGYDEAERLFLPTEYPTVDVTPDEVLHRVREMLQVD